MAWEGMMMKTQEDAYDMGKMTNNAHEDDYEIWKQ